MLLIAQITDTHIVEESDNRFVANKIRLEKVIKRINNLNPKPHLVIHTGDITDNGTLESYNIAKSFLDRLEMPYYLTAGNHDNFSHMKSVFTNQRFKVYKFANTIIKYPNSNIIILDTSVLGKVYGKLCEAQIAWLKDKLDATKNNYIFMHHYPINVHDKISNTIALKDVAKFASILDKNVKAIFCGHYHNTAISLFNGIPCFVSPSVVTQFECENDLDLNTKLYSIHTQPSFTLHKFTKLSFSSRVVVCAKTLN